jgi:hypothetical protein
MTAIDGAGNTASGSTTFTVMAVVGSEPAVAARGGAPAIRLRMGEEVAG